MRKPALVLALLVGPFAFSACQKPQPAAVRTPVAPATSSTDNGARQAPPPPATAVPGYQPSKVAGMVRLADKGYFFSPSKWPRATITVCWEAGTAVGPERAWVEDAVDKSWQASSHNHVRFPKFVDCAANAAGIRIAVRDDGLNDGPHTIALGRFLDSKPNGMVLNFTFNTWSPSCATSAAERESCIRSIAVHEFGHALGFAHEQNRSDTPGECTEKPQGQNGNLMLTPWDLHSVMNYCNPIYNNNGILSPGDVASLNDPRAYGG